MKKLLFFSILCFITTSTIMNMVYHVYHDILSDSSDNDSDPENSSNKDQQNNTQQPPKGQRANETQGTNKTVTFNLAKNTTTEYDPTADPDTPNRPQQFRTYKPISHIGRSIPDTNTIALNNAIERNNQERITMRAKEQLNQKEDADEIQRQERQAGIRQLATYLQKIDYNQKHNAQYADSIKQLQSDPPLLDNILRTISSHIMTAITDSSITIDSKAPIANQRAQALQILGLDPKTSPSDAILFIEKQIKTWNQALSSWKNTLSSPREYLNAPLDTIAKLINKDLHKLLKLFEPTFKERLKNIFT